MNYKVKKTSFISALSALLICALVALVGNFTTARAAEFTADDYKVSSVAIRLVNDEYGTGVRFTTRISKSKFDNLTNAKTAVLIMPEAFVDGEITASSANVLKIETTGRKENGDYYESAAYVYDIPAASYGLKLVARGYLTYEENGETKEYYTAQTKAYSLTDVALSAPDGVKEQVKDYIVEKATVTFKDGETQLAQTEFNYGDKITYPATSVGADRYVEWKTSKNTTWNTEWTAQQSLTLTANYVDCFGYKVEECLYNHDENGGNSGFTTSATAVPAGFENVYEKTDDFNTGTYPEGYLHGRMSHTPITNYSEVRFAIKSSAYFVIDKDGYIGSSDKESFDGWLLFKLTKKADGIWHINISHNGVVIRDFDDTAVRTDICHILWHNRTTGITPVGNENGLTVYCTEIRAEFDDHFNVSGEVITDTLYENNKDSVMQNVIAANAKVPYGFKKVWQYKMEGTSLHGKMFSGKVLSAYKEVRFALKSAGTISADGQTLNGGVWTYITLTQNSDKTWNLKAENGATVYTKENIPATIADYQQGVYTADSLNAILYAGSFTFYPIVKNVGDYIYYTEVRGELPAKPIVGDIIDEKFINANGITGETTTEEIPSGYEKVWQYKGMYGNGSIHGQAYSAKSLTEYSSVNFAIKTTGSFLLNKEETYAPANEWLYFNLVQNNDNTWNVTVENRTGKVIRTDLNLNGYKGDKPGVYTNYALNAILYGCTSVGYTIYGNAETMTYFTEVRGVPKTDKQLTKIAVASKYEDETSDRREDAIINYYAIKEAKKWFGEFANIDGVEYITDESILSSSVYYVVIGNAFSDGDYSGLTTDTGYKIAKRNGNVYLYGKTGYGTLNALYGLLKQRYNLEMYADTVYTFSDAGDLYYEEIREETFNPSIDYNLAYDGPLTYIKEGEVNPNYDYQRRLGFVDSWQQIGGSWHNFLDYVPQSEYGTAHPEWYTVACYENGEKSTVTTLDLTTGGDAMAKVVADKIKAQVEKDEAGKNIKPVYVFGPPDERVWSNSDATIRTVAKYGTRSAEYVKFMKQVAKRLDEDYKFGRQIKLCLLAYNLVCDAPDYNAELEFYKGDKISLSVMFAPIESNAYRAADDTTPNYKYHLTNAHFTEQLSKWKALGGEVYYWNYSEYYDNYFVMLDTITNMQSKYKLMAENGVNRLIDLGMVGDNYGTDFTALKIYLKGKLARNVNENVDALVKNFCSAYYGTGGEYIYSLLTSEQGRYKKVSDLSTKANNGEDAVGIHVIREGVAVKSYWDENEFDTWYGYIKSALTAIENSGATEKAKTEYKKRVMREGIAVRYMKYYVFNSFVTLVNGETDSISAMITDAKSVDITRFAEGKAYVWDKRPSIIYSNGKWKLVDGSIDNLE